MAAAAALGVAAPAAHADQELTSVVVERVANTRTPDPTLAGAHPDLRIKATIPTDMTGIFPKEPLRKIRFDLPAGAFANPQNAPICSRGDFRTGACPPESQVGAFALTAFGMPFPVGVANLEPGKDEAARLGITGIGPGSAPLAAISAKVSPEGGYVIKTITDEIFSPFPITGIELTLWGVPGDHPETNGVEPKPFYTNGTDCSAPQQAVFGADSWVNRDKFAVETVTLPALTGCDNVDFRPSVNLRPEGRTAGSSAPVIVDVNVDQPNDPDVRAPSTLKDASVLLPEGLTINPGLASDLTACSDGAFAKSSGAPAACPAGSKIGTAGIATPLLPGPIPGDIYVGEPKPGDMFRLFVYASGFGTMIKLEGSVQPDPKTGRLLTVFRDNPPLPFSTLRLRFQGGGRAVLGLPETCGAKPTQGVFTPHSGGANVTSSNLFHVYADEEGSWCAEPQAFGPSFVAGTTSDNAGGDTGFTLTFGRTGRDAYLRSMTAELPAGLLGRLASFPLCGNAQAAANQCSEDSMVGGVTVSAGAGDSVLNLPGRVFLTEPPKEGQIAGLAIIVPAKVGPYDLGTVIVRAGIKVNRDTSLSVESDPLPQILGGVPLRLRQVTVTLDRPGFMFNPTDCSPKKIGGSLTSVTDVTVPVGSPFQVRGCANLPFAPEIKMSTAQPSRDGGTTGLRVEITPRPGDANMRAVDLILPRGVGARLDGPLQNPCLDEQLAAEACPDAALVGDAKAVTPVLPQPLSGKVYLLENVSGEGGLPRLAILLRGQVAVDLIGDITLNREGQLVANVPGVPDVPISSFEMNLATGEQAVLTAAGLCDGPATAYRSIIGHNGQQSAGRFLVEVSNCSAASTTKKAKAGKKGKKGKKGNAARRG